jgi:hypothetical protein
MSQGILGSVASRAEVTLSLTVAGRIVSELSRHLDEWSILRAALAVSVLLSNLAPPVRVGADAGDSSRDREPLSSMTLGSAARTLRRVSVIVVAQLVVQRVASGGTASPASHRYYAYHTGGGGSSVLLDEAIPAGAWPEVTPFFLCVLKRRGAF